jgi:hypothetical protein
MAPFGIVDFIDDEASPKQITAFANPPSIDRDTSGALFWRT